MFKRGEPDQEKPQRRPLPDPVAFALLCLALGVLFVMIYELGR